MPTSRHIFLQIDTEGLLKEMGTSPAPTNAQVRQYTLIGDQGSLAMGNQIENFSIGINPQEDLHFSIMPMKIFSYHILYFTEFRVVDYRDITIPGEVVVDPHTLSFKVEVTDGEPGGYAQFNLFATLEYNDGNSLISVPICIDPMLRIKQLR